MLEGSFSVLVNRQSGVPNWLPFRKLGSDSAFTAKFDEYLQRAEGATKKIWLNAGVSTAPLSFNLPGGFGIAIPHIQETAGGLRQRVLPVLFSNKKAAVFFQGCLTNLDELLDDLLSGSEAASSYGSDCEPVQLSDGDQGHVSAQIILQMYLRTGSDSDKLAMLLSELQGEYAFVIFDSSKKQVFAARDPSGKEGLYVGNVADGSMAFTNTLADSSWMGSCSWQEVLPGHYHGGKNYKQAQQFALTPTQLRMREYAESVEDLTGSYLSGANPVSVKRSSHLKDDDNSPLSNRSSLENLFPQENLFRISV